MIDLFLQRVLIQVFLIILFSTPTIYSYLKPSFSFSPSSSISTNYDSVLYANLSLKINQPIFSGPGQNLFTDPNKTSSSLYVGNTINRQAFETQFVLDIEKSIGIHRSRVYVTDISKGTNHFTWEYASVIVSFLFVERNDTTSLTLLESISRLNQYIQINNSLLYSETNVTKDIDPSYGLLVKTWDISLKLSFAIEIVGGDSVRDGYFLNQGGLLLCNSNESYLHDYYCEFENFFENDIANAVNISISRIQVLFVKKAALDSVLVYFRIFPPPILSSERNVSVCIEDLISQVSNRSSLLYQGNVTLRLDPIWGISNSYASLRASKSLFTLNYYEIDPSLLSNSKRMTLYSAYDRCKANRRCNWGIYRKCFPRFRFIS